MLNDINVNKNKKRGTRVVTPKAPADESTRRYRCMAVVRPTISSDRVSDLVNQMLVDVRENEEVSNKNIFMQSLAYAMDRNRQGHMITMDMKISPETLNKIRGRMQIDENFLRVMFLKMTKYTENFNIKDDFIKSVAPSTTKRGRISFGSKNYTRIKRKNISKSVQRLRFMGVLPYCNYG